ncbi:photosystem II reaction center protein PsbN [Geitlerinema sp. PCC 9228]|jgi:PsbN protein|nr:photosystem II reaction center protein PsbN [Geitlerinema sp. PCC 9228]
MDSTTAILISISGLLVLLTGVAIYTAFGPPSKDLADPFEEHED